MDMNFSWYKDDKVCIETLIKKWNDNYQIFESIESEMVYTHVEYVRLKPKYTIAVFRNNKFYEFDITKHDANYLIFKLDMVTSLCFMEKEYGFQRRFFQKSAYGKVTFGYNYPNVDKFDWSKSYG